MTDYNSAWIVLIGKDEDVSTGCLSGRLVRSNSSEPVIAFVDEGVVGKFSDELHQSFDSVVVAPKNPRTLASVKIGETDGLLLELLNMRGLFSNIIAIQPGVLVFQSFQEILHHGKVVTNTEGDWKIVPVLLGHVKYERVLQLLLRGISFNTVVVKNEFAINHVRDEKVKEEDTVLSWADLNSYTGVKMPFLEINLAWLKSHLNLRDTNLEAGESKLFWQNVALSKLKFALSSAKILNENNDKSWIAVVGMACRFPKANSIEEYWQVLTSGENTSSSPPPNRKEIMPHVKANFLKCPIEEFDASFFNIAPIEAATTDIQARLLLEVSWEAFEDAGINPEKLRSTPVGIFHGSWIQDYKDLMNLSERPDQQFFHKYVGNSFGCTAGKLSYFYGFTGPNIATESGCSSSMVAVQLACKHLLSGECPVALATGANVLLHMDSETKMVWSKDGICKTFDSSANGYGRGEGVGVLVMKRYSDALRDGDRIHGVIRGSSSSQEGLSKSFGSPTVENEVRTMVAALESAMVSPNQVDYVEAHATGTGVGDPIEAEALVRAYSSQKVRMSPLLIGSVKTNIGHTESCSGIASIIKVLLALKYETIPPHINVKTINPKVDFSLIPGKITLEMEEWKRNQKKLRIAGVSNFGFTGTTAHMIIQEAPENRIDLNPFSLLVEPKQPLYIFALSAKTEKALTQLCQDFATFLEKDIVDDKALEHLTYTANACRPHHFFRKAVFGRNKEEIALQFKEEISPKPEPRTELTVAFIFSGAFTQNEIQSDTYAALYSTFPVFKINMDICDIVCLKLTQFSPLSYITPGKKEGFNTFQKHLQISHFSLSYSLYKLWESWGLKSNYLMGLNVGIIVMAAVTGELTLEEAFNILNSSETLELKPIRKKELELEQSRVELISCVTGEKECYQNLDEAFEIMRSKGCNIFIDVGLQNKFKCGQKTLKSSLLSEVLALPLEENSREFGSGMEIIFSTLTDLYTAGYPIDWEAFYRHQQRRKVSLPHYPFQRKSIWFKRKENQKVVQMPMNHQHLLLGKFVAENDDENEENFTFENILFAQTQAPYLLDHAFGSEVIFPGAGFLEIAIAANGSTPFIIEDFHISRPLHLPKDKEISFKTVIRKDSDSESSTWSILVQNQRDEEGQETKNWDQFATGKGTFPPISEIKSSSLCQNEPNISEIKKRCVEEENPSYFYTQNEKFGFIFGPNFQTMKRIHRCSTSGELLVQVSIPPDALNYFCHPLLSDVMIQSYVILKNPNFTALYVPKSIKKFVCYRRLTPYECSRWESSSFYVYCNEKEETVYLLDSKGKVVIEMISPEIIPSTVGAMLTAAGVSKDLFSSHEKRQADIYQVVWKRATKFQMQDALKLDISTDLTNEPSYQNLLTSLEQRNRFTSREEMDFNIVNRLCLMYVLKAMYEMGWKPEMGRTLELEEMAGEFKIIKPFVPAFRHYLSYLVELGLLVEKSNNAFTVKALPDKAEIVEFSIKELSTQLSNYGPIQSINICGSHLARNLQGKVKGQQLLNEVLDNEVTLADQINKTSLYYRSCADASSQIFFEIARNLGKSMSYVESDNKTKRLRILELGGKTGMFMREAISLLEEEDIQYTYFFTETSPSLTKKVEQVFPNDEGNIVFKALDIEKEPLGQGFPPAYFDIVVALNVLHNTKKLRTSLENIRRVLKPGGNLIVGETCQPIREMDLTFGAVEGYWQFKDLDVRPSHPTISADRWITMFKACGLDGPSSKSLVAASHVCIVVGTLRNACSSPEQLELEINPDSQKPWLLIHDLDNKSRFVESIVKQMSILGRTLVSYSVWQEGYTYLDQYLSKSTSLEGILFVYEGKDNFASENCRSLLEPLLNASKSLIKMGNGRLCVVTFGLAEVSKETPVGCPSTATVLGFLRCLKLEIPSMNSKLVDLDPDQNRDKMVDALVQELWMGDDETEICYRKEVRYVRRLVASPTTSTQELMAIPHDVENYSIQLPQTNLLSDLTFASKSIEIGADDVIVDVRAASLNFKDVLNLMKPSEEFKTNSTIGIDFSGVVSSVGTNVNEIIVGTPVFGCSWNHSTFCRYLPTSRKDLFVMPQGITFEEAATFPLAFLTAWYCLVNVAQASAGQTVLIHAASGGVGLIAIQIAKLLDLKIVATAGSQRKRAFLSNLRIPHVFNSRNLEYGQRIKEITNGQGVDIVLNCLTGPGFIETSLDITKVGGYFVEISKLDIWTEREVKMRKPEVNYKIIDLNIVDRVETSQILSKLVSLLQEGSIKPLPFTRFTASRLIQALKFLQKAKHIGKVVISMPKFDIGIRAFKDSLFNEMSTYLITGGKGAIGLAIAEWMVSKGAKYLVLMGRGRPTQNALEISEKLVEQHGTVVIFKAADVSDLNQCKQVLQEINEYPDLPPLRGIHHCAGVLSDRILMNQDWDNFEYVLSPKVKGAHNLHILTENLPLEFFAVHSSMAATFGNFGQSNYSAANTYMEALIAKRRWMGLQGMSVSWGQWNVGLAEDMDMELCEPMTINQGIVALENIHLDNSTAVVAGFLKYDKLLTLMPTYHKTFLEDIASKDKGFASKIECGNVNQLKQTLAEKYLKAEDDEQREITVRNFVRERISETLGLEPNDVGDNVKFASLGLDSLLGVEFYNNLQAGMGDIQLGYIDMDERGTVEGISYILKTLLGEISSYKSI